jgi:hypothetical protein
MHTQEFIHNGLTFQVRVISDGISVFIRVFKDGVPANGLRYEATLETVHDAATVAGLDVVKTLVETAINDIKK